MRKLISIGIIFLLLLSLTGCNKEKEITKNNYLELNLMQLSEYIEKNIENMNKEDGAKLLLHFENLQKIEIENYQNKNTKEFSEELKKIGYKLETAEGDFFPVIDYSFYNNYIGYVTEDIKEYFTIMTRESEQVPAKDAALVIDKEEIFKRALNQEKFLINHPTSERKEEIELLFSKYIYFIYYGLDNTPLFDYYSEKMKEENVTKYKKVIEENPESSLIKDLSLFMDILERNNYALDNTSKEYREAVAPGLG